VQRDGWQRFTIPQAAATARPGAAMSKATRRRRRYFIALGAIAADGGPVRIEGRGR
jgi:3-phosphoshikimate 1-carboxyvinyltransferase